MMPEFYTVFVEGGESPPLTFRTEQMAVNEARRITGSTGKRTFVCVPVIQVFLPVKGTA